MRISIATILLGVVVLLNQPAGPVLSAQGTAPRASSTFVVTYDVSFDGVPAATAAVDAAAAIWSTVVVSPVPIRVRASFDPRLPTFSNTVGSNVLGGGAPAAMCNDGATWYPAALWDKIAGRAQCAAANGTAGEITLTFNPHLPWDFGTTGAGPAGKYSLMTTALHQIAHGLGFYGSADGNDGAGRIGRLVTPQRSLPDIFDRFAIRGDGAPLLQLFPLYPSTSGALSTLLFSNDVYFYGPNTVARAGGAAKLHADVRFIDAGAQVDGASTYNHLDLATYLGSANGLMIPKLSAGQVFTDPGPVVKGMLADLGWTIASSCSYAIGGSGVTVRGQGASGLTIAVAAPAGCGWTASSTNPAVTITGGAAGAGFGTVSYTVAPNPTASTRVLSLNIAGYTFTITQPPSRTVAGDFDGDGASDFYVWRASAGTWYWASSAAGGGDGSKQWGNQGLNDVPLLADIDGDRKSDLVIWRPGTGMWFWLTSSTGYDYARAGSQQWGSGALGDIPLLGDVDGDGKADFIVWRPGTGTWYWLTSSTGYDVASAGSKQWGSQAFGDVPLVGDLDGDGRTELIVWRAPEGMWYWLKSASGYSNATGGSRQWGSQANGDRPLIGDFDGDGKGDLAVWRAPTGTWYWLLAANGYTSGGEKQWGSPPLGDVPRLPDLDGDGRADFTVWRGSSGTWIWLQSSTGFNPTLALSRQFGNQALGDVPMSGKQ